ncbi:MAG: ABC transporter ATP-binding protein, partial [Patescibacteria group bacterium]
MLLSLYRPFLKSIIVTTVFIIVAELSYSVTPYAGGLLIDSIIAKKPIVESLKILLLALAGQGLFILIFYLKDRYELAHLDFAIPKKFQRYSLEKMFSFSIGQHAHQNSVFQTNIIKRGEDAVVQLLNMFTGQIIPEFITVLVMLGAMLIVSPFLGLLFSIGVFIYVVLVIYDGIKIYPVLKRIEDLRQNHGRQHGETIRNSRLVISHAQEERFIQELDESRSSIDTVAEKVWQGVTFRYSIRQFFIHLVRFGVVAIGLTLVAKGQYTAGYLVTFWLWSGQVVGSIRPFQWIPRQVMREYAGVKKFYETTSLKTDVPVAENPIHPQFFFGKIEFKNVSYSYRPRGEELENKEIKTETEREPAINNMSFVIKAGEHVAFVGESGAGKSTIISMLLRAHDPDEGQILVDGNDLRLLDLKQYRRKVGMVEQDVTLFDDTLKRNILFGLEERMTLVSDEELQKVCQASRINRFFEKLEKGFETVIGERGVKLSGGERQRVGIARALIKEPVILIFDEATSSLDAQNESAIREAIHEASQGRTTITVAHRFSTIKQVDRIFVIENGSIIGVGTHEELMSSS